MLGFSSQQPEKVLCGVYHGAPAGAMLAGVTAQGQLCRLSFLKGRSKAAVLAAWREAWPKTQFKENLGKIEKLPAAILLVGTRFQQKVWQALLKIPAGTTISYGEMARRIGKPQAARAVGGALRANPVPFCVPCHRVIAADGSLGGFAGGRGAVTLAIKKDLLRAEGAPF